METPKSTVSYSQRKEKMPWPKGDFPIPDHKFSTKLLENLESMEKGSVLDWDLKHELYNHLTNTIVKYTWYPTLQERQDVANALVSKFPNMQDTIGSGIDSVIQSLKDKMSNKRRGVKTPEVMVMKRRFGRVKPYISASA